MLRCGFAPNGLAPTLFPEAARSTKAGTEPVNGHAFSRFFASVSGDTP
jgi:hypothetical protein